LLGWVAADQANQVDIPQLFGWDLRVIILERHGESIQKSLGPFSAYNKVLFCLFVFFF
jgi:hypothetical protein